MIPRRVERIKADVDIRQPRFPGLCRLPVQQNAVRGHGNAHKPARFVKPTHQIQTPSPRQRLAARDAHLSDAKRLHQADDADDFLIPQQSLVRDVRHAVLRHTVDAAQVAAVGHGNAQIVDGAAAFVKHRRFPQAQGR